MRTAAFTFVAVAALAAGPSSGHAQDIQEILATIRNGGGWVSVPIQAGHGTVSTLPLPTMGLTLSGCVNVWAGHSGEWEIRARETVREESLSLSSKPGEGARFAHEFGMRAQIEVEFEWSEPRDTTLFLWVGLDREDDGPDEACTPK